MCGHGSVCVCEQPNVSERMTPTGVLPSDPSAFGPTGPQDTINVLVPQCTLEGECGGMGGACSVPYVYTNRLRPSELPTLCPGRQSMSAPNQYALTIIYETSLDRQVGRSGKSKSKYEAACTYTLRRGSGTRRRRSWSKASRCHRDDECCPRSDTLARYRNSRHSLQRQRAANHRCRPLPLLK